MEQKVRDLRSALKLLESMPLCGRRRYGKATDQRRSGDDI